MSALCLLKKVGVSDTNPAPAFVSFTPRMTRNQIEAQRSGLDLERKNNTIGQSDAACGG